MDNGPRIVLDCIIFTLDTPSLDLGHTMTLIFYNLALLAALVATAPWWLWRMMSTQKYREGLKERLGEIPTSLRRMRDHSENPVIWLHAVSVGEVLAVSRLVSELDWVFAGYRLLVSTTTYTGQALARERFGASRVFYCPLDLPWAVYAYLQTLRPHLLILAETEFWPNLLSGCFHRGIPVAVVNARISDRSWPRYQMLKPLWKPLLGRLSAVLAQTETDRERLLALGCQPGRVRVAGNLKFDVRVADQTDATRLLTRLAAGRRLLVAGSTLEGEESALLAAWPKLLEVDPELAMVLAPRHPERFSEVAGLLGRSGFPWQRRSDWPAKPVYALEPLKAGQIVLLDSIGELASIYSLASVAFVGGSLVPAGGHNPLEPAQFAVPIVMGPSYANFRAITDQLRAHQGVRIVDRDTLAPVLIELLTDPDRAADAGYHAKDVFDREAGATDRCLEALRALFEKRRA
jgi:3-deoxy-D-manno-octulosonic-acid transferase